MYNKKNLAIIGFFGVLSIIVFIIGLTTFRQSEQSFDEDSSKHVIKSHFTNVHYFKLQDKKPSLELQSEFLNIINNAVLTFNNPIGSMISSSNKIDYSAKSGIINQGSKHLNLSGSVKVKDKLSEYSSDEMIYDGQKDELVASGSVKTKYIDKKTNDIITLNSNKLKSKLNEKIVELSGSVSGELKRKRVYEGKLNFSAEEIQLNSSESRMIMSKSVKIHRNKYDLSAENAEIFLENYNKKLKYYTLYDDVKLEEKFNLTSGKVGTRRAYAERLEAHQKTGKILLSGAPRVEQGDDIIKGYQITLRENVEMVEVDDSQSSFSLKRNEE